MTFTKRKSGLLKKAMELSVLCDCDIAVIIFNKAGKLFQYSNKEMEDMLEKYSVACQEPHERWNNEQVRSPVPAVDALTPPSFRTAYARACPACRTRHHMHPWS